MLASRDRVRKLNSGYMIQINNYHYVIVRVLITSVINYAILLCVEKLMITLILLAKIRYVVH